MTGGEGDPLGIVQEVWIWPYKQIVFAQPRICSGKWDAQTSLGFWDTNRSLNLGQTTWPGDNQQKKRTCQIVDFAILADYMVKLKEGKKKDNYLDFTRELKILRNMTVIVIPLVIGTLGTVTKELIKEQEELEIRGQVATIKTTASLRSARIQRIVQDTWEDLLSLKFQWETIR